MVAARSCADRGSVHTFRKIDSTSFDRSWISKSRRASTCSNVYKRSSDAICEKFLISANEILTRRGRNIGSPRLLRVQWSPD